MPHPCHLSTRFAPSSKSSHQSIFFLASVSADVTNPGWHTKKAVHSLFMDCVCVCVCVLFLQSEKMQCRGQQDQV